MSNEDPPVSSEMLAEELKNDPLAKRITLYSEIFANQAAIERVQFNTDLSYSQSQERLVRLNTNILQLLPPNVQYLFNKGVLVGRDVDVADPEVWGEAQLTNYMDDLAREVILKIFDLGREE